MLETCYDHYFSTFYAVNFNLYQIIFLVRKSSYLNVIRSTFYGPRTIPDHEALKIGMDAAQYTCWNRIQEHSDDDDDTFSSMPALVSQSDTAMHLRNPAT